MCSSHRPEAGADSIEYRAFRVFIEDEAGGRAWIRVPAAMGPNDARNQALETAHERGYVDAGVIAIEEVMVTV